MCDYVPDKQICKELLFRNMKKNEHVRENVPGIKKRV